MMQRSAICLVLLTALATVCVALDFCPFLLAQNTPTTVARPSWATPERLRGPVDASTPVAIQVHLPLRDLEAAKAELEAVSDPDSPRYGHYLTSEEFEAKYSPSPENLAAVRSYFEAEGFTITYVPRNRQFLVATAPAATAERVFATRLGQYEVEKGELRRAPINPATIPAAISARVAVVLGLHTSKVHPTVLHASKAHPTAPIKAQLQSATPTCSEYYGQYFDTVDPLYGDGFPYPTPLEPCGLTPPRVRRAYGLADAVAVGNDGRGITLAITGAWLWPTLIADAQAYAAQFDRAHPLKTSQITTISAPSGGDPQVPVDNGFIYEQVGDVEWVHGAAPGAHILYVYAATNGNNDVFAALNLIVQDNLASIISNSWVVSAEDPNDVEALDPILLQAGLKGIGTYFGSGDWGDNQCGGCPLSAPALSPTVAYPASSPYTTAVGGTSLYLNADGSRAYETGWETGDSVPIADANGVVQWVPPAPGLFFFGAGGGPSHRYAQPNYQQHHVPAALAGSPRVRVLPDVAMLADQDSGSMEGITDPVSLTYTVFPNSGGTSLATPLFAGTVALAEQRAGHRIGFANPKLYRVADAAFRDIVPTPTPQALAQPSITTFDGGPWTDTEDPANLQVQRADGTIVPHTLHSAPGFDNVTGLGVPNGETFLQAVSGN